MQSVKAITLSLFLLIAGSSARGDWRFAAESGTFFDSNLSNSDRASDEKSDWAWKSTASLADGFQLARDLRLTLGFDARGELWNRFDAFDEIGAGVSAGLRYRFGLGARAPWISLEERAGYDRFRETARSNWNDSVHLSGGIALNQRVALEAGYTFENRAAPDDFFDQRSHRLDGRVLVDLTPALQVALGYSYRDGDVIAYAVPPRPEMVAIASERRPTDTFGNDPLYTAYHIGAQTHAVSISAGYILAKNLSVQIAYEYAATAHDPLHYENHLVEAKIGFAY